MGKITDTDLPPINEVVGLLEKFARSELEALRRQFPDEADLFQPGIHAGEPAELALPRSATPEQLQAVAEACRLAIEEALSLCSSCVTGIRRRLERAHHFRRYAQVAAIVTNSALLAVLLAGFPKTATIITGVLALVVSLFPVFAEDSEKVIDPTIGTLADAYGKLVRYQSEAARLQRQLLIVRVDLSASDGQEKLYSLFADTNDVCENVNVVVSNVCYR